jgi:hypothetical protein
VYGVMASYRQGVGALVGHTRWELGPHVLGTRGWALVGTALGAVVGLFLRGDLARR